MLIVGIILSLFGIGLFCWLLFTLAACALPFFACMTASLAAYHYGSGLMGSILVDLFAGGAILTLGQIAFDMARTPCARGIIATVFAAPAAIAGDQTTHALVCMGISSEGLSDALAIFGAVIIGCTAWVRLAFLSAHQSRETLHHPA